MPKRKKKKRGNKIGSTTKNCAPLAGLLVVSVFLKEKQCAEERLSLDNDVIVVVVPQGGGEEKEATTVKGIALFDLPPGDYHVSLQQDPVPPDLWQMPTLTRLIHMEADGLEVEWFVFGHLAPVHFIWFGTGAPSEANTNTPSVLAEIAGSDVNYWCLQRMAPAFTEALHENVSVRSIEELVKGITPRSRRRHVNGILDFYKNNRGFAPAKDLISFLVLEFEGGYFFDANCTFELEILQAELSLTREQPAFVKMDPWVYLLKDPSVQSYNELTSGFADGDEETRQVFRTDMWALYGPPGGSEVFQLIANQYIARARRFGFFQDCVRTGFQPQALVAVRSPTDKIRRGIVGAVAVCSIQAGMAFLLDQFGEHPPDSYWETESGLDGGDGYAVACLGLRKTHGYSW